MGEGLKRARKAALATRKPKPKPALPPWPKTLRVVLEDCNWDGLPQFHSLQPGEKPPDDVLGVAVYELKQGE